MRGELAGGPTPENWLKLKAGAPKGDRRSVYPHEEISRDVVFKGPLGDSFRDGAGEPQAKIVD